MARKNQFILYVQNKANKRERIDVQNKEHKRKGEEDKGKRICMHKEIIEE